MAKNLANYLGLKLIKPLPFESRTQLPVGGLLFVFFNSLLLVSVFCRFSSGCCLLSPTGLGWCVRLPWIWSFLEIPFPMHLPCLASLLWVCSANCKSQSCLNTSRDDWKFFRTISSAPSMRLFTMTDRTCAVAGNANLASLLCVCSQLWRNTAMKWAQTWCQCCCLSVCSQG